ncbi:MAG: glutathione S-transferase [Rhodospirillales bacterium]|nr:glutathione S-transferase [Rhodospirillales bacterium]
MYRLHDNITSGNAYKVRLLLSQLCIPFERIEYDIDRNETREPEFLQKNPNGRIPLLELAPGRFLAESNAILCYLAEDTHFLPADRLQRAQAMQWLFFEQYNHEPNIATVRYWITHKIEMTDFRRQAMPVKRADGIAALGVMEQHLAGREWFVGTAYSIADIALYAYTHVADQGGFDLVPFPSIRRWLNRVAAEPNHVAISDTTVGAIR